MAVFRFILLLLLVQSSGLAYSQKKVDQVIPEAEKRKVIRARKMFNQYRIAEGEKILKALVNEHPSVTYYHEALVQLQRQVLDRIGPAYATLDEFTTLKKDSLKKAGADEGDDESETYYQHETKTQNQAISKKDSSQIEWNGLDPGPRSIDKNPRKHEVSNEEDGDEKVLKEAVMTIDSSILKQDIDPEDSSKLPFKLNVKKDKALEKQLKALSDLAQIPYDRYKADLIRNCRRATLEVEYADSASSYLRTLLVDTLDPDLKISDASRSYFENGVSELDEGDAMAAKLSFEKAIDASPAYYSAQLYLAEACMQLGKDTLVLNAYHAAVALQPKRSEPLEKLSLFLYERGKFEEAAAACIQAISLYPEQQYIQLLKRIVSKTGIDFNTQWIHREVYPLAPASAYAELLAKEKTPWWTYQAAEAAVLDDYDSSGIVKSGSSQQERYLEVYAWKQMLKDTARYPMPFARAMNKMGYLDCYVLITCFHHDLYKQFVDFTKQHPEKVKEYFYILINWEHKKFAKVRKEFEVKPEKKGRKGK